MKTPDQIAEESTVEEKIKNLSISALGFESPLFIAFTKDIIKQATKPLKSAIIEWNSATNERDDVHLTSDCTLSYPCEGCKRLWDAEAALGDIALKAGEKKQS